MRRDAEFFGEAELDLVYMARRLNDALGLEDALTSAGVDYLVETGTYTAGIMMKRELTGAFFYVAPKDVENTRLVLTRTDRKPYKAEDEG